MIKKIITNPTDFVGSRRFSQLTLGTPPAMHLRGANSARFLWIGKLAAAMHNFHTPRLVVNYEMINGGDSYST